MKHFSSSVLVVTGLMLALFGFCSSDRNDIVFEDIAVIAQGWRGEIITAVDQSYAGWDVEIGDADNDGKNEIVLATGKGDRTKPGISYVVIVEKNE